MTWLPSLVTMLIFVFGIIVYRWQKTVDRETELLSERRKKYDDYIVSRHRAYASFSINPRGAWSEELIDYSACRDKLMIQVPDDVMDAVGAHAMAFERLRQSMLHVDRDLGSNIESEFRQIVEKEVDTLYVMLGAFRNDLGSHSRFLIRLPSHLLQGVSADK